MGKSLKATIKSVQGDMAAFSCYFEIKYNIVGVKVQTDYRKITPHL